MIDKLRSRLLLMVMVMSTLILIAAFLAIYMTTYFRVQAENEEKLSQEEALVITAESSADLLGMGEGFIMLGKLFPDQGISFNMVAATDGTILLVDSAVDLQEETYYAAASAALDGKEKTVALEDRFWQYAIHPADITLEGIETEALMGQGEMVAIRFLDITDSLRYLHSLLMTLIGIGCALMVMFFFISRYFANRAIRPLLDSWERQRQFVTDASHELKTPLGIARANVDVLYTHKSETIESQIKWLDNISTGVDRMTDLVGSLLALAKTENTAPSRARGAVNLDVLIDGVIMPFLPAIAARDIVLSKDMGANIQVQTEPDTLAQILSILMDNAVKYTENHGRIYVAAKMEKRSVILSVRNTGQGIAPSDLPHVFERFYRCDESRQHQDASYGLGLSIAENAVKKLGGTIAASSIPGESTTFTVQLPAR